jgi:hypothetical protein
MGYKMPTYLRFAVRASEHQQVLLSALRAHFGVPAPGDYPVSGKAGWSPAAALEWALKFSSQ